MTMRMNPEVKAKWLAALRSGEYKQGRGRLRSANDEFCCLGVLCDLYAQETGKGWEPHGTDNWTMFGHPGVLPGLVARWAATSEDPLKLSGLNDDGATFTELADKIEEAL